MPRTDAARMQTERCQRCHGTGSIEPAWPVGPGGTRLSGYTCPGCNGTGQLPNSPPVMNPPAQAEAGNRAHGAPSQADPDAGCRGVSGLTSGSEARPVTPTAQSPCDPQQIANAVFEGIGALYARRYGRLRPGKDDRVQDSMSEENIRQFQHWIKYEALDDAVLRIAELEQQLQIAQAPFDGAFL